MCETDKQFEDALRYVKNSTSDKTLTTELQLKYYALYKQATVGPCAIHGGSQPSYFHFAKRQKWNHWNALNSMTSETAKEKYVEALTAFEPRWREQL